MRKRVIGIILCLVLICTLLPSAFADTCTVSFNPTGATQWSANPDRGKLEVKSNEEGTITVPANPRKDGYIFKGWSTAIDDAEKISIPSTDSGNNVSFAKCNVSDGGMLYAIWELFPSFSISPSALSLYTNSFAAEINATDVLPTGVEIDWAVDKEGIIQIEKSENTYTCTVTPVAAGTATVTATCGDAKHTCAVTVTAAYLRLSSSKLSLNTNTTKVGLITATTFPADQKVEWSSSDETIVKVIPSNDTKTCTVSALKAGTATVTATCGTKKATCTVTVTDSTAATAISLDSERLSIVLNSKGTGTGTLKATVTPSTATEVIQWKSSDETVATVAPGNDTCQTSAAVTAKKAGTATITAYTGDGTVKDSCDVVVKAMSISFTELPKTFTNTDSYSITATVTAPAAGSITWKSSDTAVMTVTKDSTDSTGRTAILKPVGDGEAQITVSFIGTDGSIMSSSQTTTVALPNQTYKVVYNSNGSWYYDAPSSYQIKVNAPYTKAIKSISIYNKQSGTTYYPIIGTDVTKQADLNQCTILTFTQAFMQTLPHYEYQTMTITFEDGTAVTYLHILSAYGRPITGDVQFNPYWIMLALGAAGLGAALTLRKKEEY